MKFSETILVLVILLLQAVGVGSAQASSRELVQFGCELPSLFLILPFKTSENSCCSALKNKGVQSGMELAEIANMETITGEPVHHSLARPVVGVRPVSDSVSSRGGASALPQFVQSGCCCSGCQCNLQDRQAPPISPDSPCAASLHSRFSPPTTVGDGVFVPPLPPVSAQSHLAARARAAWIKPPVKRAHLSVLHCAFLI